MEITHTITLAAWLVALLGGTVVPILTGLATKLSATPGTKAVVGLLLSTAVTLVAAVVNARGVFVAEELAVLFATTFTAHVTTYYGLWKPVGGGAAPGAKATAGAGLG